MTAARGDYPIVEIFLSIQGEGLNTGRRAIFVRKAGCNLSCPWCDTDYACRRRLKAEEIADEVRSLWRKEYGPTADPGLVVLTGGEPTIHDLDGLIDALRKTHPMTLALETNGTNPVTAAAFDFVAVAPKASLQVHESAAALASEFKIVVGNWNAGPAIRLCLDLAHGSRKTIWLQPEGNHRDNVLVAEQLQSLSPANLRVGHQMHKIRGWK